MQVGSCNQFKISAYRKNCCPLFHGAQSASLHPEPSPGSGQQLLRHRVPSLQRHMADAHTVVQLLAAVLGKCQFVVGILKSAEGAGSALVLELLKGTQHRTGFCGCFQVPHSPRHPPSLRGLSFSCCGYEGPFLGSLETASWSFPICPGRALLL